MEIKTTKMVVVVEEMAEAAYPVEMMMEKTMMQNLAFLAVQSLKSYQTTTILI